MKRIVGAILFGLGVLLVVCAAGLPLYIAPAVSQLPYDLEKSISVAESPNAEFLQIKSGAANVEKGTLRSTVEVLPQAKITDEKMTGDLKGKAVVWDVYQTVERVDNGEKISQYSTELAIDRRSGAAAKWDDAWLEDGTDQPANYAGQVYKFPFGTEKKDYPVYDRDLRRPVPAKFQEVTKVRGVEVYRFEQVIPEEPLSLAASNLKVLLARFAPGATTARLIYSNTRTFWVEPISGAFVDLRDQPHKELVPDVGAPTVLLNADFRYDEKTAVDSAERADTNGRSIKLLRTWAPIGLGGLGAVVMIAGALMALRRSRQPAHAGKVDDDRADTSGEMGDSGGPLTDVLPPPSTNWSVPDQRSSSDRPAAH